MSAPPARALVLQKFEIPLFVPQFKSVAVGNPSAWQPDFETQQAQSLNLRAGNDQMAASIGSTAELERRAAELERKVQELSSELQSQKLAVAAQQWAPPSRPGHSGWDRTVPPAPAELPVATDVYSQRLHQLPPDLQPISYQPVEGVEMWPHSPQNRGLRQMR